ncbi:hypothetical protein MKX03_010263 [Papaver bracteatum]|nr:hypothetical protein MKX03_010263 [Papaver bracteatum]
MEIEKDAGYASDKTGGGSGSSSSCDSSSDSDSDSSHSSRSGTDGYDAKSHFLAKANKSNEGFA